MTAVHIYTVKLQPATRWTDACCDKPFTIRTAGNALIWCACCNKRRPAKNAVVQAFYDGPRYWCAPDKGCKNPDVLASKRRNEFRNRSAGQRARFARLKQQRQFAD